MPCQESEKEQSAPPQPSFTAPTNSIRNDGVGHGGPDTKETDSKSYANVEKELDKSTGMLG
jgi:hypothetical protein